MAPPPRRGRAGPLAVACTALTALALALALAAGQEAPAPVAPVADADRARPLPACAAVVHASEACSVKRGGAKLVMKAATVTVAGEEMSLAEFTRRVSDIFWAEAARIRAMGEAEAALINQDVESFQEYTMSVSRSLILTNM